MTGEDGRSAAGKLSALVAQGRSRLAEASPGPWGLDPHMHTEVGCRCTGHWDWATVWRTDNMLACEDAPPQGDDENEHHTCSDTGMRYGDAEFVSWARGNTGALLDAVESLSAQLAGVRAADPDLFDPAGGTRRGRAYETYGSPGHELRLAYLGALGTPARDGDEREEET